MMSETIKNSKNWAECEFQDLLNYTQPTKYIVRSTEYDDTYKIPVLTAGKSFIKGYTNEEDGIFENYPVIIFDDFTTATKYVNFPFKVKSSAMKILEPNCKLVNLKFVYFAMQVNAIRSDTHKRYWISVYAKKQFLIPPLNEQDRIVAKIEELFSELDNGIENLKTARAQLKVYRQALLKHAFEGKLTAEWREQNKDKLETAATLQQRIQTERAARYQQQLADWQAAGQTGSKPKAPKLLPPLTNEELAELPELPENWSWEKIDALLTLEKKPMATGPFGTLLSKSDHKPFGLPVLGIENIGNGKFIRGNKIFVSELKAKELESFKVEAGDIVISRSGTVGEICRIPNGLEKAFISTNLIRVSLNIKVINQDYFVYLFQGGGTVKQQVKFLCKGSSREFLNQTILESIVFPLPNINEQNSIVNFIDSKFSEVDQLDQTITTALQQSEALRQSILKKAFSGALVAQDANDEPASVLLARIKAEIAAKPANKRLSKDSI